MLIPQAGCACSCMGWMEAVSGVSLEAQAVCPPFGGAERRMCARALLLLPGLQKWQLGFWPFCILLSMICLNCTCTRLLSPTNRLGFALPPPTASGVGPDLSRVPWGCAWVREGRPRSWPALRLNLALRVALRIHHAYVSSICLVCLADTPHTWESGPAGSCRGQEPGPALLLGVRTPWWLRQMRAYDVGSVLHRLTGSLITGLTS